MNLIAVAHPAIVFTPTGFLSVAEQIWAGDMVMMPGFGAAHGLEETETGIASKLARGTFSATFFFACLAVLKKESISLEDI